MVMCGMTRSEKKKKRGKNKQERKTVKGRKENMRRPESCLSSLRGNANRGHPCEDVFLNTSF